MVQFILGLIFLIFNIADSSAQSNDKSFGASISMQYNSSLHEASDPNRSELMQTRVKASYLLNSRDSIAVGMGHDQTFYKKSQLLDSYLGFSQSKLLLKGDFSFSHQMRGNIPTSKEAQERDDLQGGAAYLPSIQFKKDAHSAGYTAAMTKNFHQFETRQDGLFNVSHHVLHALSYSYSLTDVVSLSVGGILLQRWNYNGTKRNDQYEISESISFTKNIHTLSLGLAQGDVLSNPEAGPAKEITLYDENDTVYFLNWVVAI